MQIKSKKNVVTLDGQEIFGHFSGRLSVHLKLFYRNSFVINGLIFTGSYIEFKLKTVKIRIGSIEQNN